MKQIPLVSIALCTYNGAAYLKQQLDSLVNQTYQNIEIIAVDDCSTDDTYTILENYASQYQQIKHYKNITNLGFIGNFERAVKLCKGELIALCDQDDIWDLKKIELQVNAIKDNIFIYHDSEFIHQDGSSMDVKMSDLMNLYRGDSPEAFLFFNCVSGHTILMKRELLNAALPLKEGYFHDWWLAYVATNIGKIDFIPQSLVKYRQHDKSETNILGIERKKQVIKFSSIQGITNNYKWLSLCVAFKGNKDHALIEQFYTALKAKSHSYVSFKLSYLLFKFRKTIFFMRKKSSLSKLNYIYSQIWGLKMKKLFN